MTGYLYPQTRNLTSNGSSQRAVVISVMPNFFHTLQVAPERGRAFLAEEETPGRDHVAIVSYELWQNQFASDPGILEKAITIDSEPHTVIGIPPPHLRFEYMEKPAVFVPLPVNI